jgi:hypothetical protein
MHPTAALSRPRHSLIAFSLIVALQPLLPASAAAVERPPAGPASAVAAAAAIRKPSSCSIKPRQHPHQ